MRKLVRMFIPLLLVMLSTATIFAQGKLPTISDKSVTTVSPAGRQSAADKAQKVAQPSAAFRTTGTDVLVNNNTGASGVGYFTQSETSVLAYGNNVVIGFN